MNKIDVKNNMIKNIKAISFAVAVFGVFAAVVLMPVTATAITSGLPTAQTIIPAPVVNPIIPDPIIVVRTCKITVDDSEVVAGDNVVVVRWETSGYDNITVDGESVGPIGSKTYYDITAPETIYRLKASTADGKNNCEQQVKVTCVPPPECVLRIHKDVDKTLANIGDEITYTIEVENIGNADCTGGGVKIFDVVDGNLTYLRHTLTSNLTAGYGSDPVYSSTDRTLRFNGNVLNPGESGVITWVGKVESPQTCGDFKVYNKAKTTAYELNNFNDWVYSNQVVTDIDNDCVVDDYATIYATKVVCTDEADLPNFGAGGPDITANTAADWVANHASCSLSADWQFAWSDDNSTPSWNTFGPTNTSGLTSTRINLNSLTDNKIWVKEIEKTSYIPFSNSSDSYSAEMYCHTDVLNYDNIDSVDGLVKDVSYYCVAWNVPETTIIPPSCDLFEADPTEIYVGATSTLTWESTNAVKAYINNAIGEVDVDGTYIVSPLVPTTYVLTLVGVDGQEKDCSVKVDVKEEVVPSCKYFNASPSLLPMGGGDVELTWEVLNSVSATINPIVGSVDLLGTTTVSITESTNFVLEFENSDGRKDSCEAPVVVSDPTPFSCANNVTFTATDYSIKKGNSTTLNWDTVDVDTVSISVINETSLSGSKDVTLYNDTTYVLTATRGTQTATCPLTIEVDGGGGGGSPSPRCELKISDKKIKRGDEITITWDTTNAREVTLKDDTGKILFTTDDYLSDEKEDYFDGYIKLKPTRDTEYTLIAERGSKKRECRVEVEMEDNVVVLQTRDQQPLVAGISLSQVPYTGFEAGPIMTVMFYLLLIAWALYITYLLVVRNVTPSTVTNIGSGPVSGTSFEKEEDNTDLFAAAVAAPAPRTESVTFPNNLPTGTPVIGYENDLNSARVNPHQVNDIVVTELENRAHQQMALLSSDAVRHFIATTEGVVERNEALDSVIVEAKKHYPLEDGWIVVNEARMKTLCEECIANQQAPKTEDYHFAPATVPEGTGSLAEAIVTGNVVAAYEMIGNRPMFALADAAADLDAVYRNRIGGTNHVSEMLTKETQNLSDAQIKEMINALTGALDGTYTDEASAVKMAILKAVKVVA